MMQSIRERLAVAPEQLRRRVNLNDLPESTAAVPPLEGTIGQSRALDALTFGIEIGSPGYHLFVAGSPGSGREHTVHDVLQRLAPARPVPSDWVYVYNFAQPDQPRAIPLPQGRGRTLAKDLDGLIEAARRDIPRAFESEEYVRQRRETLSDLQARRNAFFEELQAFAHDQEFAIETTPAGMATVPLHQGKPLSDEEFEHLPATQRKELEQRGVRLQERIADTLRLVRQLQKEGIDRVRQLNHDVALFTLGPHFDELRETYADQPAVLAYLEQVRHDVPEHLDDFRDGEDEQEQHILSSTSPRPLREEHLARYRVNVFVANDGVAGAPVIVERNPTYYNLLGRIDYRAVAGTMSTGFRQIKPGALQRANGGFLILHVLDVLGAPFAWEALKRSLLCREARIENLGEQHTGLPTERLRPEPTPLDVKVILLGPPDVYPLLYQHDPDFPDLFQVKADFAPDIDWTTGNQNSYVAYISRRVRQDHLRHFDREAMARVIEEGARLREDQRKLSLRLRTIADIVSEANYWAGKAGHDLIGGPDVAQALAKRRYRANLVEERLREMTENGDLMIATTGSREGQVNGLSVMDAGGYAFGVPSRLTARISPGRGSVQSIEREIHLSGPIHSKGILTLSGYLAGTFCRRFPLALNATITFEQSYNEIEGDSASSTELYALLSALAGLPLRQDIAVTGSVNQHGEIQAVGGVTTKIEGFFALCKARGLTGEQGVLIPAANVPNLMLDDVVVEAVQKGQFHIWAVQSIDEGIELLTGCTAGQRDAEGQYPSGTVYQLVENTLRDYAEHLRTLAASRAHEPKRAKISAAFQATGTLGS